MIRLITRYLVIAICWIAMSGCSSLNLSAPVPQRLELLPPAEGPTATLLKQKLTLTSDEEARQFILIARIQPDQIGLVVLLATGQKILSMHYDGINLTEENYSRQDIPARELLALMQFVVWPEPAIRRYYREVEGWLIDFKPKQRSLLTHDDRWLKVNFEGDKIMLENYHDNYSVVIDLLKTVDL